LEEHQLDYDDENVEIGFSNNNFDSSEEARDKSDLDYDPCGDH